MFSRTRCLMAMLVAISAAVPQTPAPMSPSLYPGRRFPVGSDPQAIAAGDVNGDGIPDLVTANGLSGDISVLVGLGDGTFAAERRFSIGESGRFLALADCNGDGTLDVVITHQNSGYISLLSGKGDGTFGTPQRFSAGISPSAVAAVDLNGDGVVDIVTANSRSNDVSVLYGKGRGAFEPERRFPTGASAGALALADLNGDQRLDIITGSDGVISVLLADGSGFQPPRTFAGRVNELLVAADIDGDGRVDLIGSNRGNNEVNVWRGRGDGSFDNAHLVGGGRFASLKAVADLNGDRRPDIIFAIEENFENFPVGSLAVLLNADNIQFKRVASDLPVGVRWDLAVVDVNGDGVPDIAVAAGNSVLAILAEGAGRFEVRRRFAGSPANLSLAAGDFDGDGKADIVINGFQIIRERSDGTYETQPVRPGESGAPALAADMNNDGRLDLITNIGDFTTGRVSVLLGNGDGTFRAPLRFNTGPRPSFVGITDLNGDSRLDVLVIIDSQGSSRLLTLLGNGDGSLRDGPSTPLADNPFVRVIGDLNGDGIPDLIHNSSISGRVSILIGNGDGSFQAPRVMNAQAGVMSAVVADFNRDGRADLVLGLAGPPGAAQTLVLLGNGDGTFQAPKLINALLGQLMVADANGDGIPDLAGLGLYGLSIFIGNGDGTFQPGHNYDGCPGAAADFDGDGRVDFAGICGDGITVLLHKRVPAAVAQPIVRGAQPVLQAFLGGDRISPGTWVEIYGENFVAQAKDWSGLIQGNQAPTLIDGVRVNFGSRPAYLYFVSPTQINAQVPDGVGSGSVSVAVVTAGGSASTTAQVSAVSPALLTTPAFQVGGRQYVAALFATELNQGRQVFVGRPNLIPGAVFRPAKPGDALTIFAVGCGPTNPPSPAGLVAQGLRQLTNSPQVLFGQTVAQAAGFLSAGAIGLCQLNVTVPNVVGDSSGDVPISVTIGGVRNAQNLFTTIQP